jgi:voltage-gated potassium channel
MGALGYRVFEGWPLIDSFYMAVITVTTVGFSEVHPLTPGGRFFTAVLALLGVGAITYSFGAITRYLIAGELGGLLGERRMRRLISSMHNHFIVCGYGRMGHEVCLELQRERTAFVVIDENEESVQTARDHGYVAFLGDPGLDETLRECHIEKASGLATVSDDDAKNLMVVISARGLNPELPLVARASTEETHEKFIRAGADSVFIPYRTGGQRLAQMLVRPEVVVFLEDVLHDKSSTGLMLEHFEIKQGSWLDGQSLGDSRIRENTGAFVVGLKRKISGIEPDLHPSLVFQAGDSLIVLGKRDQLDALEKLFHNSE